MASYTEEDILRQELIRQHFSSLPEVKDGGTGDVYLDRRYVDESGQATSFGLDFEVLAQEGLVTDTGEPTVKGQTYLMSLEDSENAQFEIYKEREKLGLNQRDRESAPSGGLVDALGQFFTQSIPAYSALVWDAVVDDDFLTVDEELNASAEFITGSVTASSAIASGVVHGSQSLLGWIQADDDAVLRAKQQWERTNREHNQLKGAEMMHYLTDLVDGPINAVTGANLDPEAWLQGRENLKKQYGEERLEEVESAQRLGGSLAFDPQMYVSAGIGAMTKTASTAALRSTLWANRAAMTARGIAIESAEVGARRAAVDARRIKASALLDSALEKASALKGVGDNAGALKYEGAARRAADLAESLTTQLDELASRQSVLDSDLAKMGNKPEVAQRLLDIQDKIDNAKQIPTNTAAKVSEGVGARLVIADEFLSEAASRVGLDGAMKALKSLPGQISSMALTPILGPLGAVPSTMAKILASGPAMKSAGNFFKVLGAELIKERASSPFWRNVANANVSKPQRMFAHFMDEATLGGRLPKFTKDVAKGTIASYPFDLALGVLEDPYADIGTVAGRAFEESFIFGGGAAGAGSVFQGKRSQLKEIHAGNAVNFLKALPDSQKPTFGKMSTGGQRFVSNYAAAFPNKQWKFTESGPSEYNPITNTTTINVNSRNPIRALISHEVQHYVTIRNQMQNAVHHMLLGDATTAGLVRSADGKFTKDFEAFKAVYDQRIADANLPPSSLEQIAEEYFNESTVDYLMEMMESGEMTRMAGRTEGSRFIRGLVKSMVPSRPILQDFFFRTGGAMDKNGKHVMGNGLLAEGIKQHPEAIALMRRLIQESAGSTRLAQGLPAKKDSGSMMRFSKDSPMVDSFSSLIQYEADGITPMKDKDGNHVPITRAQNAAREQAGLVLAEEQSRRVAEGYLPDEGELRKSDDGSWQGRYIHKALIDELSKKDILNSRQIQTLRHLSTATKTGEGFRFLITNHPATIRTKSGKLRYDGLEATIRETVPVGFSVTQKGNVLVHLINLEQLNRNIETRAASKRGQKLYQGNTELIKQDVSAMADLHSENKPTDDFYKEKYGPAWQEHKNFINTVFGLMTRAQRDMNPLFDADKISKDGVFRTYRLDRISRAVKMDGTPIPLGYEHIKANYLPEGVPAHIAEPPATEGTQPRYMPEESVGDIDPVTELPLNADGTVTLYHGTTKDAAASIIKSGTLKSKGERRVYLTTDKTAGAMDSSTGYGDGTVVEVRVKPDQLELDDEFPDGRRDFAIDAPSKSVRISSVKIMSPDTDTRHMPEPVEGNPIVVATGTKLKGISPTMIMPAKWGRTESYTSQETGRKVSAQTSKKVAESSNPAHHRVGMARIEALLKAPDITPSQKKSLESFVIKTAGFARDSAGFRDLPIPKTYDEARYVIAKAKHRMTQNLLAVFDSVPPPVRNYWQRWYPLAYDWNGNIAGSFNTTRQAVAGMNARLSPGKDWIHNVNITERILQSFKDDVIMSQDIIDGARPLMDEALDAKLTSKAGKQNIAANPKWAGIQIAKNEARKAKLDQLLGMKISQMTDSDAALLARFHTQIKGDNTVINYFEQGNPMYAEAISWQSFSNIEGAINIYRNPELENISAQLGDDHKIRSFYNNQEAPHDNVLMDVTSDTHAVAAAYLSPFSQKSIPVGRNFGQASNVVAGMSGMYYIIGDAYRAAAKARGVEPRAMQSITWEGVRSMYPRAFKSKENAAAIADVWTMVENGKLSRKKGLVKVNELVLGFLAENPKSRPRVTVIPKL